jgi:RimJ/RimL family protein N-acetyltransferase
MVRVEPGAMREVVRTYLELRDPTALRGEPWTTPLRLVARPACSDAEYRRLYAADGAQYAWHDRDAWTDDQLAARLGDPGVRIWVVEDPATGVAGGYFELEQHDDGAVEIAYFGLVAALHGRRLGAQLLTAAVDAAWAMGATRVWLHTCTLDAPAALPNYLARGFRPVHTERYLAPVGPIGGGG